MIRGRVALALVAAAALASFEVRADTVPIDLNAFPGDSEVTVAVDGRSAQFVEVEVSTFVRRTNDPFSGDVLVIPLSGAVSLRFDFEFDEAAGAQDEFSAVLFDAGAAGGPFFGELERFTVASTQSGVAEIDLTAHAGLTLGLEFELLDVGPSGAVGSTATVSNLVLETVPEPTLGAMLAAGAASLLVGTRRRLRSGKARP